ncbi:Hypothetical_protein [Hexamita inflata]|uniref:Hypothetical_protein n=1 Tax=Hexamita inflata TaxID=28002 RepID=A0AA86NN83_9EUKA|nr:Hypothetical protein HINF_LOCUS9743 [Hexamita inflata]
MVALNAYLASITDKQVTFQEETQIIKHLMQWLTYMQKKQQITLIIFIQTMMKMIDSEIHLIVYIISILQIQKDDKIPINHYKFDNFQYILALKLVCLNTQNPAKTHLNTVRQSLTSRLGAESYEQYQGK